ncbi:MAG TPA: hypothetical protein PKH77_02685 [Anaerolineae bacterium]|nr:hypothetical protein [Anaerolineae bacterium]
MADLKAAVQKFSQELADKLQTFINDVTVLEVRTFTTPHDQVKVLLDERPDIGEIATKGNVQLRAYTQIGFDGDATICLPTDENNEIDRSVWDIHQAIVAQAIGSRNAMLRTIGDAASSALGALQKSKE